MAAEPDGELSMPAGGAHGGGVYVSGLVRGRLLSAVFSLVGERGYEGVSTRSVAERAGASTSTFYQCFSDREDCFLAAFEHAVDGLQREMRVGWESELGWTARVRGGLTALLRTLDREPAVRRLVFVEALAAGPRVLACRARVLEQLAVVIDQGRVNAKAPERLPGLVAEGVVGATFGVIHARVLEARSEPLVGLLGQLMATIVLPYRGSTAAARELARPASRLPARPREGGPRDPGPLSRLSLGPASAASASPVDGTPVSPVDFRLTARTQSALVAVAGRPGLNSREVSELVGLADQGQVSRMMKRLAGQGLVEDTQAHTGRQARAWRLTADGEAVVDAHKGGRPLIKAQYNSGKGGGLAVKSPGRPGKIRIAAAGTDVSGGRLRMTKLTRQVLTAVSELSRWGANPSNRKIATAVGVKDEGQISKHLARLQHHGLLENTGGHAGGHNAWQLTRHGEQILLTGTRTN